MVYRSVEDWSRDRNGLTMKEPGYKISEKIEAFFEWVFIIAVVLPVATLIVCLIIFVAYHGLSLLWRFTIDVVVYTVEMFGFDFDYKPLVGE